MTQPTAGEIAFARTVHLDPNAVAAARVVLNAIADLPWPEDARIALLARLAHEVRADVGPTLSRLALLAAPLASFDRLIAIIGLAEKRVSGLVRALYAVDPAQFTRDTVSLREALERVTQLQSENVALRTELDHLRVQLERGAGTPSASVMRLEDVASSITSQLAVADDTLRSRSSALRLTGVELRLHGGSTAVGDDLALDFAQTSTGGAVAMSFATGGAAPPSPTDVAVPDVRGYTPALARRKLVASGFAVTLSTVSGGRGVVSDQSPAAGSLALSGTSVRLIVR